MAAMQLTRTHRILIGVVVTGAVFIAAIGFAGSYAAVRELAEDKGFGDFSLVFPIGIDAGICVLLALDLLLTWMRIPFPLLRQTAWLLTAATIAFNGAASWPDPLGVGMHAVIPILFVVSVEAARHAVGRIADITADKHMEGVRLTRWLLSPLPTFKLWRRMKLWELRSYEQVIKLEQDRLIYQARLQARYGRSWRRKAPVESLMPLRLAKYGVPLADTAPAGLAAAGIEPALLPPELEREREREREPVVRPLEAQEPQGPRALPAQQPQAQVQPQVQPQQQVQPQAEPQQQARPQPHPEHAEAPQPQQSPPGALPQEEGPGAHESPWFAAPQVTQEAADRAYDPTYDPAPVRVPSGPGRTRPLGGIPGQRTEQPPAEHEDRQYVDPQDPQYVDPVYADPQYADPEEPPEERYYGAFRKYVSENNIFPTARELGTYLQDLGTEPPTPGELTDYTKRFEIRYQQELDAEHIA
ncbi:DUF2637 domain-containing protein [Streptomyces hypolithicus]